MLPPKQPGAGNVHVHVGTCASVEKARTGEKEDKIKKRKKIATIIIKKATFRGGHQHHRHNVGKEDWRRAG